jgi:hypothetical protein
LSEFLQRMQNRLKAKRNAPQEASPASSSPKHSDKTLGALAHIAQWLKGSQNKQGASFQVSHSLTLKPASASTALTYLLMVITAVSVTYWLMRIAQIPGPPSQPASGINKGITLYSNQDGANAYGLFGSKPIVTDNIYLRGVVATSKSKDGTLDGFAIFEIDGKPTNAISVGETLGKGLSLQSIGDESATLLYQGQKLDFKLSKPGKDKGGASSTTNKK